MKNDAAKARNAKTRALKPRTLKPGEKLAESDMPIPAYTGKLPDGDRRIILLGYGSVPPKRRHIAIDFPLFAICELFRIFFKTIRLTLKAIAHVFLLDVAAKGARKVRQRRRVRLAMAAHDKSRQLRLPPDGVQAPKLSKLKTAKPARDGLPLDYASSDRIEPRVAVRRRAGRPAGARDKHPRKKRAS